MNGPERPWTNRVVTDASVEIYNSAYFRYARGSEDAAKQLASDLKKLFEAHSDWHGTDVIVHKTTELRCSLCGLEYEEDADGPVCCDRAQEEFRKNIETREMMTGIVKPNE